MTQAFTTRGIDGSYFYDNENNFLEQSNRAVKQGKKCDKAIALIQKYFPNCDNAWTIINSNIEHNKTAKKSKYKYILEDFVGDMKCE